MPTHIFVVVVVVIHLKNVSHFALMFYFWTYCFFLVGLVGPVFGEWRRIGPKSSCGFRCVVCGLMFSPTPPAEGTPDLFISAGEAAVSNSSGYLFVRLYTALAALCSLTCGPMCARPHTLWLRTTRLLWAPTYYKTGWGRLHLCWWIFFLCIFSLKYFSIVGACTA